jgi:hypothetical protein
MGCHLVNQRVSVVGGFLQVSSRTGDIERQIAVPASRIAPKIDLKRVANTDQLARRFLNGLTARSRSMKGAAISYPRIGRYDQIWTGLCRFFSIFFALREPLLTGFSNLLNFLD